MFVVFALTIVSMNGGVARRRSVDLRRALPGWRRVVVGLLMLYVAFNFFTNVGAPAVERRDGRFFSNDHGTLTAISRATYDDARRREARAFSGHEMFFAVVAALHLTARRDELRHLPPPTSPPPPEV